MKLAVSNIAWDVEASQVVYEKMKKLGFGGLELAPTKIFKPEPYSEDNILGARTLSDVIRIAFGLKIVSMQSIWYGRTESIWGTDTERQALLEYTERAAAFAEAAGCHNLVFGCPRSRNMPDGADPALADTFFCAAADLVQKHGVVLAIEPNPPIYSTNFINTTAEAVAYLRKLAHPALRLNVDVGTMIENGEDVAVIAENMDLVSHVHISRPGLPPVQPLAMHRRLARVLRDAGYDGWVSIEMKDAGLKTLFEAMEYVAGVFGKL